MKSPLNSDAELDEDFVRDATESGGEGLLTTSSQANSSSFEVAAAADQDADGVLDTVDNCADTSARVMVDATGCEIVMGVVEGLEFGPGQVKLSEKSRSALSRYVEALQRYPEVAVAVEGHTDNRGPAAGNLELSKQRVLSVVEYMVSNGINPSRMKPFGYGESRPRAANATATGREQNRRIEIKVLGGLL